jgi:serine protease inhibitor
MGILLPFTDFRTFIPMAGLEGAKLDRVQEGVSVKVDETGAELKSYGIAGGVIGGVCGNCPVPAPFHMIVNRPFFFAVVDTRTNQTLFMGAVVEP